MSMFSPAPRAWLWPAENKYEGCTQVWAGIRVKTRAPQQANLCYRSSKPWSSLQLQLLTLKLWILSWHKNILEPHFKVWNNHKQRKRQLLGLLEHHGAVRWGSQAKSAQGNLVNPREGWGKWTPEWLMGLEARVMTHREQLLELRSPPQTLLLSLLSTELGSTD